MLNVRFPDRSRSPGESTRDRGQATVEVAILLPLLVLIIAAIAWVAQLGRDQVALTNGARAAGRVASLGSEDAVVVAALQQASGLDPSRLVLTQERNGDVVQVTASYRSPARIPLLGSKVANRTLTAKSFFLREPPPP